MGQEMSFVFLHDLDVTNGICLFGVLVKDDLDILHKLKVEGIHILHLPNADPPRNDDEEEESYPIGTQDSAMDNHEALDLAQCTGSV